MQLRSIPTLGLTALLLAPSLSAYDSRVTYVTPQELQGFGDFNNDGFLDLVTVDRSNGQFRIGLSQPDGSVAWQSTRASGCSQPEALAVGTVRSATTDDLILAGKAANHLYLIDPSSAFNRPQTVTPNGIGPASVAAIDLNLAGNDPTLMDLVSFSAWNSPPNEDQRHLFQSLGSGITTAADLNTGSPVDRASRILIKTGDPQHFATFLRSGATSSFRILDSQNPALPLITSAVGLPADADFVSAPFLGTANFEFLFFEAGLSGLLYCSTDPVTGALSTPASRGVGVDPIQSVHVTYDGSAYGIAVIYNDGDHAELFTFDASGNPVFQQAIAAPEGERLKGVLNSAAGSFHLLHGPPDAPSTGSIHFKKNGANWDAIGSADMPGTGSAAAIANVFLYDKEPLVNPDAKLVETIQVPDWTSSLMIDGSGNVTVLAETYGGNNAGLGSSSSSALGMKPGAATFGVDNQTFDEVSLTTSQGGLGVVPVQISIDPPAGTYARYFTARLTAPDTTGIDAYYRFDTTSAWTSFNFAGDTIAPPGNTLTPFTIYYYAEDSSSGERSPVYQADYAWAGEPGTLDSDGDGVPDHVELDLGLDPLAGSDSDEDSLSDLDEILLGSDPASGSEVATYGGGTLTLPPSRTKDQDGDGFSDFDEWASGSDPFDAGSTPSSTALSEFQNVFDLDLRPLSHSGIAGDQPDRDSFAVGDATYSATDLRLHDLHGDLIHFTQTDNGTTFGVPYGAFEAIPATGRDLFVIASTPPTFDIDQDDGYAGWGRELVSLIPVPTLTTGEVPYTYGGGDGVIEAANWVAAAQSHFSSLTRESLSRTPNLYDSLALILFERIVGDLLRDRGTITSSLPISLTGFRDTIVPDGTVDFQSVTPEQLLGLQTYVDPADSGWMLQSLFGGLRNEARNGTSPQIAALRKLANEIYRISAGLTDPDPEIDPSPTAGLYPSPYETLRAVVHSLPSSVGGIDGAIPLPGDPTTDPATSYSAAHTLTAGDLQDADGALAWLLTQITPRPTQTIQAVVNSTSFSSAIPLLEESTGGSFVRLYDADGNPFTFPQALDLPEGTEVELLVFTDRTDLPSGTGTGYETISATILSFPDTAVTDENLNAIDDDYELYFFGATTDPFGDADGDGFINLQESLDGTHPDNASSIPTTVPLPDKMPPVTITHSGGNASFVIEFPSDYGDQLQFMMQTPGSDLNLPFVETTDAATDAGSNEYTLTVPAPASRAFYRFRLALKP